MDTKTYDDVYGKLNVFQRHQMVQGFARDVINKLGRENITKQREEEIRQEGVSEGVNYAVCALAGLLWNHWGECNKKDTRLKVAFDIFNSILQQMETPDKAQLDAEAEFMKQTGSEITRDKVSR